MILTASDVAHSSDQPTGVLHALLANATDAIVTVDSEGLIRFSTLRASRLLGYDNAATIGTSIFSYLHADDVPAAGQLFSQRLGYVGSDTGHELRLRHCRGNWVTVRATASLLPTSDLGVISVAITPVDDVNQTEESLRRQLTVQEFSSGLGARLIEAETSSEVLDQLKKSLSDIGLLTGADAVSVFVERTDRRVLERLARWTTVSKAHVPGRPELAMSLDRETAERFLQEPFVLEDGATSLGCDSHILDHLPAVVSMISAPFDTGNQRGLLAVMRFEPGPKWLDTDAQLTRNTAELIGRALRIARTEKLLSLIYQDGPIGFSIRTWAGEFIDCNDQYLDLVGIERGLAKSQSLQDVADPEDQALIVKGLQRLKRGEIDKLSGESRIVLPDLTTRWVHFNAVRLETGAWDQGVVLSSFEDVSKNHAQRVALEYSASHDSLTGLVNRDTLWSHIDEFVAENNRLPHLLIIDIDRFKLINDSLGHSIGDDVLIAVAQRLTSHKAAADTVARLSGDEFAIMVAAPSRLDATRLAEELRRSMQEPLVVGARTIHQTMSIGVAIGDDCHDTSGLMVRADRAMYAAKAAGRNCHAVYDSAMQAQADDALGIERDLRRAIDNDELEVYFQPEFTTCDQQIVGAEALLRWNHPERGLITAGYFIDVAEQTGLIDDIGRFALREACRAFMFIAKQTDGDGAADLKLRVNISGREFARPELGGLVQAALDNSGLAPDRLCLEMTETTLMDSAEIALHTFEGLHELGVQFAIDDFGTGYSSLIYLKRFPVDTLKIDRCFIEDLTTNSDSAAIVESIIGLGHALDLEVVAEGVEHQEQLDALCSLGCDSAQGFLVSEACAADDFVTLYRSRTSQASSRPKFAASQGT